VSSIKGSRKYRDTYTETIRHFVIQEIGRHRSSREVEKAVRKRLNTVMMPYGETLNYEAAGGQLAAAFESSDPQAIRATCRAILAAHVSTRERLPILDRFYPAVFEVVGTPASLLDVACATHPFALPWMGLPPDVCYHAYDIHEARVRLINRFFSLLGLQPLARVQDISFQPPQEEADLALFLKELPRFEHSYGNGLALLDALRARRLVVSFPTVSAQGGRSLARRYRDYFYTLIAGRPWSILADIEFESELVFCLDKGAVV
jgi:16S rRNA (guanine(1405)-N(7))-methyltransferase